METAIKIAIENEWMPDDQGYGGDFTYESYGLRWAYHCYQTYKDICLDPLFWQALGKGLGWFYEDGRPVAKYFLNNPKKTPYPIHMYHWHRFIDHLAEGKDIESFFTNLFK